MELDYKDIGLRIRHEREKAKLTQQMLAEQSSLMTNSISHIENGTTKVSLPSLINIANALEVPVERLLCGVTYSSKEPLQDIFAELLADCSLEEIKVLTDICKSTKETIRRNFKSLYK
ncbi:helix-turn-helix transcriptional regulator [Anaerotruncus colihominis]|jgi:transcriptional regulator with XRE-family HTH domain|uniref:XRE family transcriptional regulator n=1 Tax=Anaerotruncus colihominis TaxID=169435 RepID=A0A845RNQ6_9FIRM|nr:helix-turn-helix transcriptional regulator [Anaerotruncus colihominis]NBI80435.1 XRE family transcriptional regulator [Anaerotruncus colihominis]